MNHRSKREVAPPPLQAASAAAPSCPGVTALQSTSNAMAPPTASQAAWWTGSLPQTNPFSVGPPDCGMDLCPPGGFLSYFQNGQQPIFAPHVSVPAPWPPTCNMSISASGTDSDTQPDAKRTKAKPVINIDDGDDGRTAKRLVWEKDEDLRLVSAWLHHSNDPINGNGKKNESYWGDVVELYNSTTPADRKREVKHLKDRWQRVKRWVGFFCASWAKACSIYTSGQSDDQLRDTAMQFYVDDFPKEGPFTVLHCWKVLRDEPKWLAVLDELDKSSKRRFDEEGEVRRITDTLEDATEKERLIGTKQAKKLCKERGKAKNDDASLDEEMKKYMDIQAAATKRQEQFLETQQRISDSKVKVASLKRESVLLESYQKLLSMDTKEMSEEMKVEHTIGLKIMRDKLVGNTK